MDRKKRTLAIGDIHGGLRALEQVIQRATISSQDKLIFLGDYVDGWSESGAVIQFLIQLSEKNECIFLKGNHDLWCEEWLSSGKADHFWLLQGGESTIDSYKPFDPTTRKVHAEFFGRLKWYWVDDENRLFVHAGFSSMRGPTHERHITNFAWDRTLWETALIADKSHNGDGVRFPKRLKLFPEIFIGHTPTLQVHVTTPMHACNVWNVDTGAAFTGKLSVLDVNTKQYWQSDTLQSLYPGERGRNKF